MNEQEKINLYEEKLVDLEETCKRLKIKSPLVNLHWFMVSHAPFCLKEKKRLRKENLVQLRESILLVLRARDAFLQEDFCNMNDYVKVDDLDVRLKQQQGVIASFFDQAEYRRRLNIPEGRWWWHCIHPWDRWDWLVEPLTLVFLGISVALAIDIVPRFWAGGPGGSSIWGTIVAIAPILFTWLFGKDAAQNVVQQGRTAIQDLVKKSSMPQVYHQEFILGLVFFPIFLPLIVLRSKFPDLAEHYYCQGLTKITQQSNKEPDKTNKEPGENAQKPKRCSEYGAPESKRMISDFTWLGTAFQRAFRWTPSVSSSVPLDSLKDELPAMLSLSAERDFKVSKAFNLDHNDASYQLGFIYELRQNFELAHNEYELALQNGSVNACIRSAGLYLLDFENSIDEEAKNKSAQKPDIQDQEKSKKEKKFNSVDRASAILWECNNGIHENQKNDYDSLQLSKSWDTLMGWVRLRQGYLTQAQNHINEAEKTYDKILLLGKKLGKKLNSSTLLYCIKAKIPAGKRDNKKGDPVNQAKNDWSRCDSNLNPKDMVQEFWFRESKQYLEDTNK